MRIDWNHYAREAYENAKEKGFYDKPIDTLERFALIHAEMSEALEADRAGKYANNRETESVFKEEKDEVFKERYLTTVKGTLEEELADIAIRLCDFAWWAEFTNLRPNPTPIIKTEAGNVPQFVAAIHVPVTYAVLSLNASIFTSQKSERMMVEVILYQLETFCEVKGIDLELHVKAKMRYNAMRPKMHGKAY